MTNTLSKLDQLRQRLTQDQEKSKSFKNGSDKSSYKFWNIPTGGFSTVRFVPDKNPENYFWAFEYHIDIPFAGIKGKHVKPITVRVPCMETYDEACPIKEEIKPLWTSDPDTARKYYRKRTAILQGFVRKDSIPDDGTEKPENPIRKFKLGKKLFDIVHAGIMDPDMKHIPTDYENGTDFHIYKTKSGQFNDYTSSKWAREYSPLTELEAQAIDKFGLPDLRAAFSRKPSADDLNIIMDMYVDSMNGEAYDADKFGKYYRPFGLDDDKNTGAASEHGAGDHKVTAEPSEDEEVSAVTEREPVVSTPAAPKVVTEVKTEGTTQKQNVRDLLAKIEKSKKQAS